MKPTKVGIIGCGNISSIYFKSGQTFEILDIVACADLIMDRAKAKAEEFGCKAVTVDQLLADPEIEIVMNLTIPIAHASVAFKAIEAGKSVHNEKPLAITREDGKKMLAMAKAKGVRVGCAPDTFMGGGIQTCGKIIDDGWIGEPIGATAFMTCHGHESWHPDPEFYYKAGGGPMFDMGPYYLTALVALMGPIKRATGSTRITFPERTITSQPKYGTKIKVDVPTHIGGVADGEIGGAIPILRERLLNARFVAHENDVVGQLPRRAGKAGKGKHSPVVRGRRDIFLGDQVHPVMQGRDQAEVGHPVKGVDLLVGEIFPDQDDRLPIIGGEFPVDPLHQAVQLIVQFFVSFEVDPA